MATARVAALIAGAPLFTVPLHMKAVVEAVNIDNQSAVPVTVQLQDTFTQDVSQANPAPAARIAFPFQATVPAGISFSADELSCKDIELLQAVVAICSANQALCAIIVNYHFE
jgi:hypothetical protein